MVSAQMSFAELYASKRAYAFQVACIVVLSSLVSALAMLIQALFLHFISPTYHDIGPQAGTAAFVFEHGLRYGACPVFLSCMTIGWWALFLRREFAQQINWPFWLIVIWGVLAVASVLAATRVETGTSAYQLTDMVFAPLLARIGMQAFLMFTLYSVMLIFCGFAFVSLIERMLSPLARDDIT